ncbi:MAG: CpsD/CapB family tyrosine-protein kinase, partial [Ruminiclostridium sp.]|nr:CpsD/CapB family tyrosine-protein kinase [Ruminiclostridium sp.]
MGVSLAVWSPIPGSGKTVFTFLLSCRLAQIIKKSTNILVCCTCMADSDIMSMAGAEKDSPSLEELVNAGIPSVNEDINISNLLCHSGNVSFIDSSKATPLFVKKNSTGYLHLLGHLKQKFDLVITDTSSEPANLLTQLVMENCDHVLNIMVQDVQLLGKNPPATQKDLAYIINRYASIYPDKKEISELLGMKNLFTLPYCSRLQEMKNRQQLYRYIELDTEYMKAKDKMAGYLVKV